MPEGRSLARAYLTPPAGTFWLWSPDGRAILWGDGTTIAFREEIESVLGRLAPGGLPPFGSLVLLLAACRDTWRETATRTGMYEFVRLLEGQRDRHVPLGAVFERLDAVAAFGVESRRSVEAKCLLAEVVFEDAPGRGTPGAAGRILGALRAGLSGDELQPEPHLIPLFGVFDQDLAPLAVGLDGVTEETLDLRRRTGLEALPEPAPIDHAPASAFSDLIDRLLVDPELGGLARVARDLRSAVHLPSPLAEPEELPAGGYGDLAPRGPLDRLLPSELAHDDLTLSVRIALGEALYLRRESPPRRPDARRTILLDTGVRLWGLPRVFATSLALALAAGATRRTGVRIFRPRGRDLVPVDLSTREGLVAHLGSLEPEPHPGAALDAFFEEVRAAGPGEPVLVTHPAVLLDPEFRAAAGETFFVATAAADGAVHLYRRTPRGQVLLGQARLALDALVPTPTPARVEVVAADPDLPLYLSLSPKPLRVPHGVDVRQAVRSPRWGVLSVAPGQRRLTHWTDGRRGPLELASGLPAGRVHWMEIDEATGAAWVLVGRANQWIPFYRVDLATGWCARLELPAVSGFPPLGIFRDRSALFLVFRDHVDLFDLESGERLDSFRPATGTRFRHGRFFSGRGGPCALTYDGLVPRFEPIREAGSDAFLFDRRGLDGPWALTPQGIVRSLADGTVIRFDGGTALPSPVRVLGVSRDGNRIAIPLPAGVASRWAILDLTTRRALRAWNVASALEPEILEATRRSTTIHKNFRAVSIDVQGRLNLLARRGRRRRIVLDAGRGLVFRDTPDDVSLRHPWIPFEPAGDGLRVARWPRGDLAFLDARGLLHLVRRDGQAPQLALAISQEGVAGWSSLGPLHGPPSLVGEAPPVDARTFDAQIEYFLVRVLFC